MPLIAISLFSALVIFSVYALATGQGRAIAFPVNRDVSPFKRFILPFVIGVVVIAAEAIILLPRSPEAHFWVRINGFLALLNGLGWGVLNVLRTERSSIWGWA